MLNAGMRETNDKEIILHDTPVQAFKILLKYIYFGRIKLSALSYIELIDVLGLVNKYGFTELEVPIIEYLKVKVLLTFKKNIKLKSCLKFFYTFGLLRSSLCKILKILKYFLENFFLKKESSIKIKS